MIAARSHESDSTCHLYFLQRHEGVSAWSGTIMMEAPGGLPNVWSSRNIVSVITQFYKSLIRTTREPRATFPTKFPGGLDVEMIFPTQSPLRLSFNDTSSETHAVVPPVAFGCKESITQKQRPIFYFQIVIIVIRYQSEIRSP